jgi:prevent-host-death family protein
MSSRISATEAARGFSALLNRVRYRGEEFIIERGGEPVGRLTPVEPPRRTTMADLVRLLRTLPHPDEAYLKELERIRKRQPALPRSPWEK